MLTSTFIHIPRVSKQTETHLWNNNIHSWHDFLNSSINLPNKEFIELYVQQSIHALQNKNHEFFLNSLPNREHWRTYHHLKHCFLDIETTGLSRHTNQITMIGLYDGKESKIFINGKNMHLFKEEIEKYDVMITYNGKCFDIPFLRHHFPDINFNKFHIDLRYVMRELGYTGGLKRIEKLIGIHRSEEIKEVDGFEAVRLWRRYKQGDEKALQLLTRYNIADIENLKCMMDLAYTKMKEKYVNTESRE